MCRADMCWCNKAQTTCWFGRTKLFWQCPVWVGSDQGCCLGLPFIVWEQNARETSQNKPIGICFWISLFKGICHLDSYKNSLPLSNFSWLRRYWNGFLENPQKRAWSKTKGSGRQSLTMPGVSVWIPEGITVPMGQSSFQLLLVQK